MAISLLTLGSAAWTRPAPGSTGMVKAACSPGLAGVSVTEDGWTQPMDLAP
jgi:hypothetical protein